MRRDAVASTSIQRHLSPIVRWDPSPPPPPQLKPAGNLLLTVPRRLFLCGYSFLSI